MKLAAGEVLNLPQAYAPVPGCTTSAILTSGNNRLWIFSLAAQTDISAEIFPYHKLLVVTKGKLEVYGKMGPMATLGSGESCITPTDIPVGMRSDVDTVYLELEIGRDLTMNKVVEAGKVFRLADLVPYQDGKIVNMDVAHNEKMKFVVMSFGAGTGLSEHAAPGEALIFALDGEGIIGYEGQEHVLKAGQQFHFAKGGLHYVKVEKPFKMALLLTLE